MLKEAIQYVLENMPASEKQLQIIRRCCKGYDPAGLSKSEANQILNRLFNEPKRKR